MLINVVTVIYMYSNNIENIVYHETPRFEKPNKTLCIFGILHLVWIN